MTAADRLWYCAGREEGFRRAYMHRARLLAPGGARRTMVKLARASSWERLRYIAAARLEQEHARDGLLATTTEVSRV